MYEKIVNYFETNLCLENMYFRKKFWTWMIGIVVTLIVELLINYCITSFVVNLWTRTIIILVIDFIITLFFFIIAYFVPINKIYKNKVKEKTIIDPIGLIIKEDRLSVYREIEINEMESFLKKECKIKNVDTIDIVINLINEELKDKYEKKNFFEKYFNNTILPFIILVLTVYFTNTNQQHLSEIIATTLVSIITIIVSGNFVYKMKNINITPVSKRENLLELKRVLIDIKIKWSK